MPFFPPLQDKQQQQQKKKKKKKRKETNKEKCERHFSPPKDKY